MKTVHQVAYELLRMHGMTTIFGNPGSNELPFLSRFPSDFRYILGLHEGVALGMADGYAQASGRPVLVNVHSAAGLGNAMGVLVNAGVSHTPLVIMAGQQARAMMALEAQLTNIDATQLPRPLVKWSFEPPRAQDVPAALARAIHTAMLPPRGPVFVSVPYDDWSAAAEDSADLLLARSVTGSGAATSEIIDSLAAVSPQREIPFSSSAQKSTRPRRSVLPCNWPRRAARPCGSRLPLRAVPFRPPIRFSEESCPSPSIVSARSSPAMT